MAIVLEQAIAAKDAGAGSITFPSWTPGANELVLVFIGIQNESLVPTVAGNGLTFVSVIDVNNVRNVNGVNVFRAMGASPSAGSVVVSNTGGIATAVVCRFSGVDTGGTNGSAAVEATGSDTGPNPDDRNMEVSVTTVTNQAWAVAVGTHRMRTFSVPLSETAISINNYDGSGGNTTSCSVWYRLVETAGAVTLGGINSISSATDWTTAAVSIKPASSTPPTPDPTIPPGAEFEQEPTARHRTRFGYNALNILAYSPLWQRSAFINEYTQDVTGYSHIISAVGGFWSAQIDMSLPLSELEDWVSNGLGRHIVVKGGGSSVAWEGLVNEVSIEYSGFSQRVGPYLDINNKIKLLFSAFIEIGDGQSSGIRLSTDYVQDNESIYRYGILQRVYSAGGIALDDVDDTLAQLLDKVKTPPRSEDLTIGSDTGGQTFDLTLTCVGYVRLLEKYTYSSATTGLQNLSTKLIAILDADPNVLFDSQYIQSNGLQVGAFENDDADAWGLVKGLVAQGDTLQNRYIFGIYENRRAVYRLVENRIIYTRLLREGPTVIQDRQGGLIQPWQIRPGVFLRVADLVPGKPVALDLNEDYRMLFVESVQFRAPDSLVVNGSHTFKIDQRLAQMGISGLS